MNKRLITLSAIVGLAALSRLLPHPPNVTPIAAMALFAGAHFRNWRIAFLMPIAAMFLSDLVLGFAVYGAVLFKSQPVVYLCMIITVGIGRLIENKRSVAQVFTATLTSAVIFYVVTNFAVWAGDALYPKTLSGMITCYTAAIPFFAIVCLATSATQRSFSQVLPCWTIFSVHCANAKNTRRYNNRERAHADCIITRQRNRDRLWPGRRERFGRPIARMRQSRLGQEIAGLHSAGF